MNDAVIDIIVRETRALLQAKGETASEIGAQTRFLDGDLALDSLDLAVLIVELEEITGHDPFRDGFHEFATVGELAALYPEP